MGGAGVKRERGRSSREPAAAWRKITRKSCNSCLLEKAWKARNAAVAAGSHGSRRFLSQFFFDFPRCEDFPTNLNVTCEQISTRSSIHPHTHIHIQTDTDRVRHCVAVAWRNWELLATTPCPQVLRDFSLFFLYLPIGQAKSTQSMGSVQHAACNMQLAATVNAANVEHQSLVI